MLELRQCLANRVLELQGALDRFGRAEAENLRLVTAIEQASHGIVITDSQGSIQYANPAFRRITGYSGETVIGGNPRVLKSGRHAADFFQNLWKTIGAGQVWNGEVGNRRADGTFYTRS